MKIISGKREVLLKISKLNIRCGVDISKEHLEEVMNKIDEIEAKGTFSDEDLKCIRTNIEYVISDDDPKGWLNIINISNENIAELIDTSIGI